MLLDDIVITETGEKAIRILSARHSATMDRLGRLSRPLMRRFVTRVAISEATRTLPQTMQEFAIALRAEWEADGRSDRDLRPAFALGVETMVHTYEPSQRANERFALSCDDASVGPAVVRHVAWRLQLLFCNASGTARSGIDERVTEAITLILAERPLPADFFEAANSEDILQAFAVMLHHHASGSDPDRDLVKRLAGLHPDCRDGVRRSAAAMMAYVADTQHASTPR